MPTGPAGRAVCFLARRMEVVPPAGLEPARSKSTGPQPAAYTNSATGATPNKRLGILRRRHPCVKTTTPLDADPCVSATRPEDGNRPDPSPDLADSRASRGATRRRADPEHVWAPPAESGASTPATASCPLAATPWRRRRRQRRARCRGRGLESGNSRSSSGPTRRTQRGTRV